MWQVWCWNGKYVKGNLVKEYKAKNSAFKYVSDNIEHKEIVPGPEKDVYYIEDGDQTVGIIEKRKAK